MRAAQTQHPANAFLKLTATGVGEEQGFADNLGRRSGKSRYARA
jgi:hypothetical protein